VVSGQGSGRTLAADVEDWQCAMTGDCMKVPLRSA
jgi:hypothetical protein